MRLLCQIVGLVDTHRLRERLHQPGELERLRDTLDRAPPARLLDLIDEVDRVALAKALVARGFRVPATEAELEKFGVFRSRSADGVFVDIFSAVGPLGESVLSRRVEMLIAGRSVG